MVHFGGRRGLCLQHAASAAQASTTSGKPGGSLAPQQRPCNLTSTTPHQPTTAPTHPCQGVNLFGALLLDAKFVGADLTGADLESAVLEGADMSNAILVGAQVGLR